MRTKTVLKNSIYSIASYVLIFFLGIINRKLFLTYLNVEFLGYEGLFSNIFSLLSLAELGIGTAITYSLYREMASKNEDEIAKLMMMYKYIYRIIGVVITIIGLILLPLLRYIITDNTTNWSYIKIIFIMQFTATICTYFLSYRRILYVVDQKQFVCIQVDVTVNIITQVIKMAVLVMLKDYVIYLLISIISNIVSNAIISYKSSKDYHYVKKVTVKYDDFIKRNFFKDLKNIMIHKVSYLIYSGIDNIVISIFLGINSVGLVSNYMLITSQVTTLIYKLIEPIQASTGNLVYSEEKEKGKQLLFAFGLVCFFLGVFVSTSYIVLFQPVIELWLGIEYLLPISFVLLLSINCYFGWVYTVIAMYRLVFGEYEKDRIYMILSAIINLTLSIIFIRIWGLTGVVLGTVIGHLIIIYGRIRFVFEVYIEASYVTYITKHTFLFLLALAEGAITYYLSNFIPVTTLGIFGKLMLCITIPNIINYLIFYKTKDFEVIKIYLHQIIRIIRGKLMIN